MREVGVDIRILHFSTYDYYGGAAKATYRLHKSLRDAGIDSKMLVHQKTLQDDDVICVTSRSIISRLRRKLRLLKKRLPRNGRTFNLDIPEALDGRLIGPLLTERPTVVCLHWINGFLSAKLIRRMVSLSRFPAIWVPLDQEPVTGGCHYSFGCTAFQEKCGHCPQVNPASENDPSRRTWLHKLRYLQDLPITFVAPTSWIADRLRESSLFSKHPLVEIGLPMDTAIFRPVDRANARRTLGIPFSGKVLLVGATQLRDPRKGLEYLVESLRKLTAIVTEGKDCALHGNVSVVSAGESALSPAEVPFPYYHLGMLEDDQGLALAYQAADVFASSTIEDAGPMMISEAMLCGTPVVAFRTGGAVDLISNYANGYIAAYKNTDDFAHGLHSVLSFTEPGKMGRAARDAALKRHSPDLVSQKYLELLQSLSQAGAGSVP